MALGDTAQHWRVGDLIDNGGGTMGGNGALRLDAGRLDNQSGTVKPVRASISMLMAR